MNGTQAAKRISEMPSSQVPEWVKGMALAFDNKALAEKTLIAFVEKVEQKVSGGGTPNAELSGPRPLAAEGSRSNAGLCHNQPERKNGDT